MAAAAALALFVVGTVISLVNAQGFCNIRVPMGSLQNRCEFMERMGVGRGEMSDCMGHFAQMMPLSPMMINQQTAGDTKWQCAMSHWSQWGGGQGDMANRLADMIDTVGCQFQCNPMSGPYAPFYGYNPMMSMMGGGGFGMGMGGMNSMGGGGGMNGMGGLGGGMAPSMGAGMTDPFGSQTGMGGPQMGGPQMGGPQMGGPQMPGPQMGGALGGPMAGGSPGFAAGQRPIMQAEPPRQAPPPQPNPPQQRPPPGDAGLRRMLLEYLIKLLRGGGPGSNGGVTNSLPRF